MDETPKASHAGLIVVITVLLGVLVALAALLDLGPFADDELTGELTVQQFIARGDGICSKAHDEFLDLQKSPPRTPSDAAELTGGLIEVAEEERDAIGDLPEPESLSEQVELYLDAREQGIDILRAGRDAAEDAEGDADAYEALQAELASTQVDARYEIAREIGFKECSKPLVDRDELERQAESPAPSDPSAPPTVNNPPTGTP